jgi:hypothetical protein
MVNFPLMILICGLVSDTGSPFQILQVPEIRDGLSSVEGNHKILDTRDLSQVNLVYNNITFQVHHSSKISNDSHSGTDVMPGEDESGTYNFSQEQQG